MFSELQSLITDDHTANDEKVEILSELPKRDTEIQGKQMLLEKLL